MINHLIKLIWKRKKSSRFLLFEFFGSFLILTLFFCFVIIYTTNYLQTLGFSYKDIWVVSFVPADNPEATEEERFQNKWTGAKRDVKKYLLNHDDVIVVTEAPAPNRPFISERGWWEVEVDDKVLRDCRISYVDDDYAKTMNIDLLKGRWFSSEDNAARIRPAVVNLAFARLVFNRDNPVGEIFLDQDKNECQIVGVIDKYRYRGDLSADKPFYFLRKTEYAGLLYENRINYSLWSNTFHAYSPINADLLVKVRNDESANIESTLYNYLIGFYDNATLKIRPLSEYRNKHLQNNLIPLLLIGIVLGFLIFNSISGLFGVLWYNISLRKSEIGLRMSVGASKRSIYKQFIGEMLALSTLGILPGIIIAVQFPILRVFDIETHIYIIAMLAAAITLYLLIVLCAMLPSSQAAKIQPAVALHEE